jgi:hypothetical protein
LDILLDKYDDSSSRKIPRTAENMQLESDNYPKCQSLSQLSGMYEKWVQFRKFFSCLFPPPWRVTCINLTNISA